jgi:quinol monooxygenase YgiN
MKARIFYISIVIPMLLLISIKGMAQDNRMYRIAKIKVDPAQLDSYRLALNEQMNTAIREEPGVLSYYAVAGKQHPENITIFEIYADTAAYQRHIGSAHFKKYKETVKNMVISLELEDVSLLAAAKKPGM